MNDVVQRRFQRIDESPPPAVIATNSGVSCLPKATGKQEFVIPLFFIEVRVRAA